MDDNRVEYREECDICSLSSRKGTEHATADINKAEVAHPKNEFSFESFSFASQSSIPSECDTSSFTSWSDSISAEFSTIDTRKIRKDLTTMNFLCYSYSPEIASENELIVTTSDVPNNQYSIAHTMKTFMDSCNWERQPPGIKCISSSEFDNNNNETSIWLDSACISEQSSEDTNDHLDKQQIEHPTITCAPGKISMSELQETDTSPYFSTVSKIASLLQRNLKDIANFFFFHNCDNDILLREDENSVCLLPKYETSRSIQTTVIKVFRQDFKRHDKESHVILQEAAGSSQGEMANSVLNRNTSWDAESSSMVTDMVDFVDEPSFSLEQDSSYSSKQGTLSMESIASGCGKSDNEKTNQFSDIDDPSISSLLSSSYSSSVCTTDGVAQVLRRKDPGYVDDPSICSIQYSSCSLKENSFFDVDRRPNSTSVEILRQKNNVSIEKQRDQHYGELAIDANDQPVIKITQKNTRSSRLQHLRSTNDLVVRNRRGLWTDSQRENINVLRISRRFRDQNREQDD